jgi:acyl-CoA synthetase (AMP-forming)/AMP-acid ligase II
VLAAHPAVEKVAVVGVPDDTWGELVTAVVVPAAGQKPIEAELIAFARERLAGFETPKRVVVMQTLPETVGGKVRKQELRDVLGA